MIIVILMIARATIKFQTIDQFFHISLFSDLVLVLALALDLDLAL